MRPLQHYKVPEAYEIYSAILPQVFKWQDALGATPLVFNQTRSYQNVSSTERRIEEGDRPRHG
jgi:hypothetical protein